MVRVKPPSPPSSHSSEMNHAGYSPLAQHSTTTSYPRQSVEYEARHPMPLRSQSAYNSSGQIYLDDRYRGGSQPLPYGYHQHHDAPLGIPYDPYPQDIHDFDRSRYATPQSSLPMSPSTTPGDERSRTRSRTTISRSAVPLKASQGRTRVPRGSPAPKIKKAKVKKESPLAQLEKPLSELTKDWSHVPIIDIEAYVNRSPEERRKETETGKQPGRAKRPMNSFMLYRKAYQHRIKNWCLQNNHQVVSQVCGQSWPLESESVRQQYIQWADIERANHKAANPGYKFEPTKKAELGKTGKRKRDESEDPDDSDLDFYDWQEGKTTKTRKQPKRDTRSQRVAVYDSGSPYEFSREVTPEPGHFNTYKSSYQASNPGQPLPVQYNASGLRSGQYYETSMRPTPGMYGTEDVLTNVRSAPGIHYSRNSLTEHPFDSYYSELSVERIDPNLVAQDINLYDDAFHGQESFMNAPKFDPEMLRHASGYAIPGQDGFNPLSHLEGNPQSLQIHDIHEQNLHVVKDEEWRFPLDEGPEFDKWVE